MLAGTFNDLGEGGEELLLVVDEATGGGQFTPTGEFADIPRVLGKEVEGAFGGCADEVVGVFVLGLFQAIEAAVAEAHLAGVDEGANLKEDTIAVLEGANDGTGVAAGKKVPMQGGEGPFDIATEKRLGGFEEITLGDVWGELGDGRFGDRFAVFGVGGEFAHLFDEEAGVGTDFGEEEFDGAGFDGDREFLGFGQEHAGKSGGIAVATDEGEVAVFLGPFGETAATIDGGGRDENRDIDGVVGPEEALEFFDLLESAFGATGDGVGEEIDVSEPDEAATTEHRDGLHGLAETVNGGFDLGDIAGEAADRFAGKFFVDFPGQFIVALTTKPADEEVIGAANENEGFGICHGEYLEEKLRAAGANQNCEGARHAG